jgi:ATP-binding cassette, subfamily B, bacterial
MQNPPTGSPPDCNGRRLSPPPETGPLRGDGRSALPSNGHGPGNGEEPRPLHVRLPRRDDLHAVARSVRQTWQSLRRVMALVWATSPQLTASLAGATFLQSVTPAAQVWLAGRLIDAVVAGIAAGGTDEHGRAIVVVAISQLLLLLGSSFLQAAGNISQQLLQERLAIHVQLQIMRHAATLDLADFENAAYYDQLQQAQRESARRPVEMVSGVFGLVRSSVTFATMVALLIGLSPWVAAAALIAGSVANFAQGAMKGQWLLSRWGLRGQRVEQFGRSAALFPGLNDHLSFLDHVHEFDPNQGVLGCLKRFKPQHRPCHPLHCSMILLHDII